MNQSWDLARQVQFWCWLELGAWWGIVAYFIVGGWVKMAFCLSKKLIVNYS
jgi:hypothetical protein